MSQIDLEDTERKHEKKSYHVTDRALELSLKFLKKRQSPCRGLIPKIVLCVRLLVAANVVKE